MNIKALNGGHFISRGRGRHPERVIDSWEIIVVSSGVLGISEDERKFEVKEGEYLLLYPGRRHAGTLDYCKGLSFFWLHFQAGNAERRIRTFPQYGPLLNREKVIELCRLFLNNQDEPGAPPENADLLLRLILNECAREGEGEAACPRMAEQARQWIVRRCLEPEFSAGELARELGCNRDYLNRIYRRAFQQTVSAAINQARMNYSRNLLLNSTLSIKEISLASGYNDETYFRRCFRRRFGTVPHKYRERHLREHINS